MSTNTQTQKTDLVAEGYCYSKFNVHKCSYMWTIERYQNVHMKVKTSIKSAQFSAINDNLKWNLHHQFSNSDIFLGIQLQTTYIELRDRGPICGGVKFSIVNPGHGKIITEERKFDLNADMLEFNCSENSLQEIGENGYAYFKQYSQHLTEWLNEDKLTIFCELNYMKSGDITHITTALHSDVGEQPLLTLLSDIEKLFSDKRFSDITISVEGENYQVHKAILAARSSVFEAMFKNNMQESASNHVDITDIDRKTFEKMLQYIYTGKVNDLEESVFEVISAADKYNLQELKMLCEEEMYKQLSKGNEKTAIEILIFADTFNAHQLKALSFKFIKIFTIGKNIENTEVWKTIKDSYPHLMPEMMTAFLEQ